MYATIDDLKKTYRMYGRAGQAENLTVISVPEGVTEKRHAARTCHAAKTAQPERRFAEVNADGLLNLPLAECILT